jgi:rare lipoprotein A
MGSSVVNLRSLLSCCLALLTLSLTACAERTFETPPAALQAPPPVVQTYRETGIASWYGKDFQGRRTASGEIFDMNSRSAAHRTLPLGTVIRVINLDNFKAIRVKVNDRGPFAGNRIIELSYGAARELGFAAQGTARVRIDAFEQAPAPSAYTVQAAVFSEEENAKLLKDRLSVKYQLVMILPFESNLGTFYRVHVGSYSTEEKAELIAGKLKLEGLEPYVMRKD